MSFEYTCCAGRHSYSVVPKCLSAFLEHDAEAVEGAPSTLGYPSPEVTALEHSQQPLAPLDMHKDDVWAVGVMGLLWLSKGQDMPFGPTRHQAAMLGNRQLLAEARARVKARHLDWVSPSPHMSHSKLYK